MGTGRGGRGAAGTLSVEKHVRAMDGELVTRGEYGVRSAAAGPYQVRLQLYVRDSLGEYSVRTNRWRTKGEMDEVVQEAEDFLERGFTAIY